MDRSTAPLTPAMIEAIKATAPEDVMAGGSTRTGLINRGMVHPKGSERFGKLTESGLQIRAKLLPAPVPEPEVAEVAETEAPADITTRTAECDNPWHASAPSRARLLCPECPSLVELEDPPARLGARPTLVILDEVPAFLAQLSINARPALEALAKAAQGLGRTLRPILEEGVRQARDIPEGRRRHGQIKARRDALRHARKLELANL
jgi:hypothetical protein